MAWACAYAVCARCAASRSCACACAARACAVSTFFDDVTKSVNASFAPFSPWLSNSQPGDPCCEFMNEETISNPRIEIPCALL